MTYARICLLVLGAVVQAERAPSEDVLAPLGANEQTDVPCAALNSEQAVWPALGRRGDGWPKHLVGQGVVTAMVSNTCSGFGCDQGLLTIRVATSDRRYNAATLYGFKSCLQKSDVRLFCNQLVRFKARKIMAGQEPCGLRPSFDSFGVPHYEVEDLEPIDE